MARGRHNHFYEIAPGTDENHIDRDEFYVTGAFTIVRHEKDANDANGAWKPFEPA